jgi:hypothetical protein
VAFLMLVFRSLGPPAPTHRDWCWIRGGAPFSAADVAFELLAFVVPVAACLLGCFVCYARVARAFRIQGREGAIDATGQAAVLLRLRAYGIVCLACWLRRSCIAVELKIPR